MAAILMKPWCVNSFVLKLEIFWEKYLNTMAANAPAPCIGRKSADMVMNMTDINVLVFR